MPIAPIKARKSSWKLAMLIFSQANTNRSIGQKFLARVAVDAPALRLDLFVDCDKRVWSNSAYAEAPQCDR